MTPETVYHCALSFLLLFAFPFFLCFIFQYITRLAAKQSAHFRKLLPC